MTRSTACRAHWVSRAAWTPWPPRRIRFVVGVDLGQSTDPTAIAILEHVTGVLDKGSDYDRHCGLTEHLQTKAERVDVRHLERLPLGLSYSAVVQRVSDLLQFDRLKRERDEARL